MNEQLGQAFTEQLNEELSASHSYLAMSAYLETSGLPGFAHWMRVQSEEEREHAMKFVDFLNDRDFPVKIQELEQPANHFESVKDVFERGLQQEKDVTRSINQLYDLAEEHGDRPAQNFLDWFVDEQVEEEKSFSDLLQAVKQAEGQKSALLVVDRDVAQREND